MKSMFNERYTVGECIRPGSDCWIFRGARKSDDQSVIIKFATDDRKNPKDMPEEIELLSRNKTTFPVSNVCHMIEWFKLDRQYIIVMEGNENLVLLKDFKVKKLELAVKIIKDLFKTVSELYRNKYIFCGDLTLDNILIDKRTHDIKLMNFGNSRLHYIKPKNITLEYQPPEYFINEEAEDPLSTIVWNLGIILYAMIFERLPFQNKYEIVHNKLHQLSQLPKAERYMLNTMLHKDVTKRCKFDVLESLFNYEVTDALEVILHKYNVC